MAFSDVYGLFTSSKISVQWGNTSVRQWQPACQETPRRAGEGVRRGDSTSQLLVVAREIRELGL
jgi:hypothetical protein